MLIGYARCSAADQNLDWQLDALKKNGCERINSCGADIRSLKEAWLDTTMPHGKLLFTISAGISQFELDLTHERTMDGLAAARARGRPKTDEKKIQQAIAMYDANNIPIKDILETTGISRATLYSYLKGYTEKSPAECSAGDFLKS